MSTLTRRGLFGAATAAAATPAVTARAQTIEPLAEQELTWRGRAIAVAANGRRRLVAYEARSEVEVIGRGRRAVDVGGSPLEVAISRDGRFGAVTTAFWDRPGLALLDLERASARRLEAGPAPFAVAFDREGKRLVVCGGEDEGTIHVFDPRNGKLLVTKPLGLVPRGIAAAPLGPRAWVALNGEAGVVRVDLRSGKSERRIRTPELPDRVAVAPDGRRLLVSHGGRDCEEVSEIDLRTGRTRRRHAGRLPSAVAYGDGGEALVALAGAGQIVSFAANGRARRHEVGGSPRGLAVAGNRVWTVDGLAGKVSRVRL